MIAESYEKLSHEEKRLLAHNSGKMLENAPKALIPFYRVMTPTEKSTKGETYHVNEQAYFAALCIRCLFEKSNGSLVDPATFVAMGRSSKRLSSVESYDNKIAALMSNTEPEFFVGKLARLFDYIEEIINNVIPDCDQLYKDICNISNGNKFVQRRWARIIYSEGDN